MAITDLFQRTRRFIRRTHYDHQTGSPILRVIDLSVLYGRERVLDTLSFELKLGDQVAVVGPNGAGKSTLFKVIAGILAASTGQVEIAGHEPGGHICIAYVPQRSQVDWDFPVTVTDVVMMGRIGKMGLLGWPRSRDWDFVGQCLAIVGLEDLAGRQISELSGGQQQRMFIARALAQEAELMLLDEPLTGLDMHSQEELFLTLETLRARGVTSMVAMHDLDLAATHFNQVMLLNRRLLGFGRSDDVFIPDLLMQAYGGHLRIVETDNGTVVLGDTCCDEGAAVDEPAD